MQKKLIGAVTHKLKKDQIVRAREIENAKNVDIQSLKSSDSSLKDEWLVIVFSLIFIGTFYTYIARRYGKRLADTRICIRLFLDNNTYNSRWFFWIIFYY